MNKIRGEVLINGKLAREGQPVLPGDKVTTGVDSEAIYVIDGNAFLQRSNSVVLFGKEAAKEFFRELLGIARDKYAYRTPLLPSP